MFRCFHAVLSALLVVLAPTIAQAQALNCKVPQSLSAEVRLSPQSNVGMVETTGSLLAISWSPQYCRNRLTNPRDKTQCSGANGRFGFILHGLWVETAGRNDPQFCAPATPVPESELKRNFCMTPSAALMQHEWAKHGTCATDTPERYFAAARRFWGKLAFPNMDALSHKALTVRQFQQAFAKANRGLPESAISVRTDRGGWLDEVMLCIGTKGEWRACPAEDRGAPPTLNLRIWRGN